MTWEDEFYTRFDFFECSALNEEDLKAFIRTQKSLSVQDTLYALRAELPKPLVFTGRELISNSGGQSLSIKYIEGANDALKQFHTLLNQLLASSSKEHGN